MPKFETRKKTTTTNEEGEKKDYIFFSNTFFLAPLLIKCSYVFTHDTLLSIPQLLQEERKYGLRFFFFIFLTRHTDDETRRRGARV